MKVDLRKIQIVVAFICIILLGSSNCYTVRAEESDTQGSLSDFYVSESEYNDKMDNTVVPYLNNIVQTGYFVGQNNVNIYYEKYVVPNSKASIVISHGFTEYTGRYKELIYYFIKKGYSVYILDHRGHGHSGNLGTKDSTELNVDSFEYYVLDFKTFLDNIVLPSKNKNEKLLLYAHSMGGCIGALFLEQFPQYFNAAILNSPMLEINTGNVPSFIAKPLADIMNFFGLGNNYVFGQGKYTGEDDFANCGTSSKVRYEYARNKLLNQDQYAQRGGASFHWLQEAFNATKEATNKDNASEVKIPVVLFQAENDTYVGKNGQIEFAKYAGNCTLVPVSGSKHEIYRENDSILPGYLNNVFNFYDKQSN